ncbi:MAG: right-handed parallel beta-helix repeat-containing protein, partial [Actinobacteria bacterium]|nr:right-handed parallel beta-helix repeat-containing protein [Actinomycetota bacterium]
MSKLLAFALGAALAITASPAAARAQLTTVTCGQTLTHSVRLTNDLTGCPGDGLVVGADGVSVDLNDHTITGSSAPAACDFPGDDNVHVGIRIVGHAGVSVADGVIRNFDVGVRADGAARLRVHAVTLTSNPFGALGVFGFAGPADGSIVDHNRLSDSACGPALGVIDTSHVRVQSNTVTDSPFGVILAGGDHNMIAGNVVSEIRHDAVIVCCGDSYNTIRANTVRDNHVSGILLCCFGDPDKHDTVVGNTVTHNPHQGILLEGVAANTITGNHVAFNGDGISLVGDRNTIRGNDVSDTTGCPDQDGCGGGIEIDGGNGNIAADNSVTRTLLDGLRVASFPPDTPDNVDTILRDNRVRSAGRDGIAVAAEGDGAVTGALLDDNDVQGSADDGIDVRSASTTLTDNLAAHNADLGIDAVPGVTDGGGNRAFDNGNPLQCT